ncbi:ABC transporter substrate-binding protein [Falsirhodobacter deserti]|uniref:ABC transporter substrate-binding protein n=1 Tax=Falsirhodobacter deserti TaxID=1365611 RepID=UPI000FE2B435|nr:ABC transporter substrate-binding protein [Falsirhodobacter deserti]
MKFLPVSAALLGSAFATAAAAQDFDLNALIEAARSEPPLTVYDSTGKIKEQADAFARTYGLQAEGIKSKAPATLKIVTGEARAGNVRADVVILSDAPAAMAQLVDTGYVTSYLPPDMEDKVPALYRDPLVVVNSPNVWSFNTELNESCPVSNIWELTEPEWRGHVSMQDPLGKPSYTDWFNQMATHHDDAMAAAYEAHYGKPLETDESSATGAWVAAMAANQPLLTDSDSNAAEAVGAPDATENFIGLVSTAKFRENANGMTLGLCADMQPFAGWLYPSLAFITTDSDSPNAAKLFVHYLLTEEGIAPQAIDGKMSTNTDNALPADEPSGVGAHADALMQYDAATAQDDWNSRQDWQDLWALSRRGS